MWVCSFTFTFFLFLFICCCYHYTRAVAKKAVSRLGGVRRHSRLCPRNLITSADIFDAISFVPLIDVLSIV